VSERPSVSEESNFLNVFIICSEEKLRYFINNGFDPDKRCQYDILALKLQFNKLVLRIRKFMLEHSEQECPDIFEHLKMVREVINVFQIAMNLQIELPKNQLTRIESPDFKSTPDPRFGTRRTPGITVTQPTIYESPGEGRMQKTPATGKTPPVQRNDHKRIYKAVQTLERTLNGLPSTPPSNPGPSTSGATHKIMSRLQKP
jgi:hypothetical protein